MKKLLSWVLTVAMLLTLPTLALAKGKKEKLNVSGKVTAVTDNSVTVSHGKKNAGTTKTITVPKDTPIKDDSGADVPLATLVGKHVKIKESGADTAQSILVKTQKGGKKKK